MFTGIVQGVARVVAVDDRGDIISIRVEFPSASATHRLERGASVALDGCCLTATDIDGTVVGFDLVQETVSRTTFGGLKPGMVLNFERSLKFGDELGGHVLSGHVDTLATIVEVRSHGGSRDLVFTAEPGWFRYIFEKGYVALNGTSLTLARVDKAEHRFSVSLIPETLAITTFASKGVGDAVHVEIDRNTQVIVETVERIMQSQKQG